LLTILSKRYGTHPDLRSFPTRRSSDLVEQRLEDLERRARVEGHAADEAAGPVVGVLHRAEPLEHAVDVRARLGVHGDDVRPGRQDRKSTRLNSSHVAISYAVFCLKKKK